MNKIIKNENRCDNAAYCGAKRHCPTGAILFDEEMDRIIIDEAKCIGCGKCVRACPHAALSLAER